MLLVIKINALAALIILYIKLESVHNAQVERFQQENKILAQHVQFRVNATDATLPLLAHVSAALLIINLSVEFVLPAHMGNTLLLDQHFVHNAKYLHALLVIQLMVVHVIHVQSIMGLTMVYAHYARVDSILQEEHLFVLLVYHKIVILAQQMV